MDSRIEVRRLSSLPFPTALLDNEALFEACLKRRSTCDPLNRHRTFRFERFSSSPQIAAELSPELCLQGLKALGQRDVCASLRFVDANREPRRLRLLVELPRLSAGRDIGNLDQIPALVVTKAREKSAAGFARVLCQPIDAVGSKVGRRTTLASGTPPTRTQL